MSKYLNFDPEGSELVYTNFNEMYRVYWCHPHGRYYLVSKGKRLAMKNNTEVSPDYQKWIEAWRKNATKQLSSLDARIEELQNEKAEVDKMLGATI